LYTSAAAPFTSAFSQELSEPSPAPHVLDLRMMRVPICWGADEWTNDERKFGRACDAALRLC
jgi:hypothetical protein